MIEVSQADVDEMVVIKMIQKVERDKTFCGLGDRCCDDGKQLTQTDNTLRRPNGDKEKNN